MGVWLFNYTASLSPSTHQHLVPEIPVACVEIPSSALSLNNNQHVDGLQQRYNN